MDFSWLNLAIIVFLVAGTLLGAMPLIGATLLAPRSKAPDLGLPYECGIARFRETSRGHIMGLDTGMLKMIFSMKTRRLLGVHIVGEGATELIHIGQAVLNLKGTVDYFVENTFNYPTLAEAYKIAGLDAWNRLGELSPTQLEDLPDSHEEQQQAAQ